MRALDAANMQTAALIVIFAFALWLAVAGTAGIVRPAAARSWIGRFANSQRINIAEQAWRGLAGAALIVRAPLSGFPQVFGIAGWIMVVSAAALLVIPLRLHANYALWWSRNLPLAIIRVAGLAALAVAAGLVATALR